jgi:hypothetical protein
VLCFSLGDRRDTPLIRAARDCVPHQAWTHICAPLDSSGGLMLLEDDWAALGASTLLVLHAPPSALPEPHSSSFPAELRVVFSPAIAVREAPRGDARIVARRRVGDVLTLSEPPSGNWARVLLPPRVSPTVAYVMLVHQQFGRLLEATEPPPQQSESVDHLAALERAFVASGIHSELIALNRLRGVSVVALGGSAAALCGELGECSSPGLVSAVVREADIDGSYATLTHSLADWHCDAAGRGLRRDGAAFVIEGAALDVIQGLDCSLSRDELRRAVAAAASASRAAEERSTALARLRMEEDEEHVGEEEEPSMDAFGVKRGGCALAGCAAYRRPQLRSAGPNSGLLLLCAGCGAPSVAHERQ